MEQVEARASHNNTAWHLKYWRASPLRYGSRRENLFGFFLRPHAAKSGLHPGSAPAIKAPKSMCLTRHDNLKAAASV
jgi:hypothetical protein